MTTLPSLTNWEKTATSLHQATQLLGAIRLLALPPLPSYLELSTVIRPDGLSTGSLPFGEVIVNFQQATLVYQPPTGESLAIPLAGQTQAALLEAVLAGIEAQSGVLAPFRETSSSLTGALLAATLAGPHPLKPKMEDLTGVTPLEVDQALSADYINSLYRVFTATARFRARLTGPMTPVVVWPEHFDLSFLWFATGRTGDAAPQMNFGFAPYSPGLPRPYLYAYAFPMPAGFEQLSLPAPARWNTEGWNGVVVAYDELAKEADPESVVEKIFLQIYELLAPTLGGSNIRHS